MRCQKTAFVSVALGIVVVKPASAGGGGRGRSYTYCYTVTTRMTPALRQAAMRAILIFHWLWGTKSQDSSPRTTDPQTTVSGKKGEPKRSRTEVPLLTRVLKELHWLPVKFRCQYKIATLAYRHFEGSLPPYLSSSLCTYEPSRSLRSSNEKLLKIPKRNLKSFGQRSFSFMAPSLWNSLPATLRNVPTLSQFKSQLKTFLFAQAFL